MLHYDLAEIKRAVDEKHVFNAKMQANLEKAIDRERNLVGKKPETREDKKIKTQCVAEVYAKYPTENLYIPEK